MKARSTMGKMGAKMKEAQASLCQFVLNMQMYIN